MSNLIESRELAAKFVMLQREITAVVDKHIAEFTQEELEASLEFSEYLNYNIAKHILAILTEGAPIGESVH